MASLQQVAVMSNSLAYPIILAREAGLSGTHMLDFICLSNLTLGIATVLLCAKSRFIGSGYLCPAGYTQIYLGPSLFAVKIGGLALAYGMTIVAGFLQLAMAPTLRRMRALLPSEIAGLVIAIVGLSLASLGLRYGLGITDRNGFEPTHLAIAGISLVTMIVLNIWTKGYAKMFCVLIGISVGYVGSAALGLLDIAPLLPADGLGPHRPASAWQCLSDTWTCHARRAACPGWHPPVRSHRPHQLALRSHSAGAFCGRRRRHDAARDGRRFERRTSE
jgi:NCS2 family nucleobase:cation symporter-2